VAQLSDTVLNVAEEVGSVLYRTRRMVERGHEKTGADTYPQQFKCPAAGRRRRPDGRLNRRVDVYCNPTATPASPISTKQRKAFYPHGTVCMLLLKVRFSNNGDRNYVSSV